MGSEKTTSKNQISARESYSLPKIEQQRLEEIQDKFSGFKPVIKKSEIVRIGIYKVSQIEEKEAQKILEELGRQPVGKQKKDTDKEAQAQSGIRVSERQWRAIKDLFPPSKIVEGRPQSDQRSVLNSILYIFRFDKQRRKVPSNYSSYATARRRLTDWKKLNLWRNICNALINDADEEHQIELRGILLRTWLIETNREIK